MLYRKLLPAILSAIILYIPFSALEAQDLEQGIRDVAQQLSTSMSGQVKKLAVVEFPDLNGYQSSLGQFVAEELITQLSMTGKPGQFDVVERRQLARVLQEQELTDSSLFEAASIAKIGKMLGIEAIITGSIADLGQEIKINARAISVETAKVFAAASTKVAKNDTVKQLMHQSAGPTRGADPVSRASAIPRRQIQRGDVFFQNDFLRVEVSSVAVTKSKNRVSFSLVFQNLSPQDILLAVDRSYHYCRATVTDNNGVVVPTRTYGQDVFITGLPCLRGDGEKKQQQKYARLSPGSKTSVVVAFENEHEFFEGNIFSISADLIRSDGEIFSKFSMGISDIEAQN